MEYKIYVCDTETTGVKDCNDVIEVTIQKYGTDIQKTWFLKPLNPDAIDTDALRVNGHKLEDLLHKTKEGKEKYLDPNLVLVDIENWIMEDCLPAENRILCGHNISFDMEFLKRLWTKCDAFDSFPFGRRILDTMQIQIFMDMIDGQYSDSYSLSGVTKKYGVVNKNAHSSLADVKATSEVLTKQVETFKKRMK